MRKCSWGKGEPHVLAAPKSRVRWAFRVTTTFSEESRPGYQAQAQALTGHWACFPESRTQAPQRASPYKNR